MDDFIVIRDFIAEDESEVLLKGMTVGGWKKNRTGKRDVQIYGPWHDSSWHIIPGKITPHAKWLTPIKQKIRNILYDFGEDVQGDLVMDDDACEIFINRYKKDQGIRFHHDQRTTYNEYICGVSLVSSCIMTLKKGTIEINNKLPPLSAYVMRGDARYVYQHGIKPETMKGERISITFRTLA